MTQHVDPASLAFLALSSREQAQVYLAHGWTIDAIADEFGVTEDLAMSWVGLEPAEQATPDPKTAKARALYQMGYTQIEIAEDLHLSPKTVAKLVADLPKHKRGRDRHTRAAKAKPDGRLPSGRAGGADAPQPAPRSSPDGRSSLTQEGEA